MSFEFISQQFLEIDFLYNISTLMTWISGRTRGRNHDERDIVFTIGTEEYGCFVKQSRKLMICELKMIHGRFLKLNHLEIGKNKNLNRSQRYDEKHNIVILSR